MSEPESPVEGGIPLPFIYNSKDWLGKTPKSYVMEYFQRSNLQPPKWIRESHSTRQLHLIKVTFQDPTGKEVTLHADRYFCSVKDAEHNTSILVLCHLMHGVKEPKDIIERMAQLQNLSKLQKRKRQEVKPLRMGAYSFKNKMYSRNGPHSLYGTAVTQGKGMPKQYENYGYGYDYQTVYDAAASTYAQDYTQLYNAYYQAGYGYDYSGYGTTGKTNESTTSTASGLSANRVPEQTTQQVGFSIADIPSRSTQDTTNNTRNSNASNTNTANSYSAFNSQNWPYQDTNTSTRNGFSNTYTNSNYGQNQFSQSGGYTSF